MCCSYELAEEKYEFFKDIDKYMKYDDMTGKSDIIDNYNISCNFIHQHYGQNDDGNYIPQLINMCKQFLYLVESVYDEYENYKSCNDCDIDYLNYWLNNQLTLIAPDKICKKPFYQNMLSTNRTNMKLRKFNGIYDIAENELTNMNSLYTFYKNYNEINKMIIGNPKENNIIQLSNKCVAEYKKLKEQCTGGKTKKFCETLNNFKKKYEEIDLCKYKFVKWTKKKLPSLIDNLSDSLPECETSTNVEEGTSAQGSDEDSEDIGDASNIDMHNITIGAVSTLGLSFIFFVLYKFTTFGQLLRSLTKQNENIWENIEEETNHFSHTSEHEHFNSENKLYDVGYNSFKNT
ncbi:PIR protein [Plasmodium ovale]|uniref:PIR Superfamily Protein n=2 Tax=Plasmodium ovale TaxID=36330 RepID=A0A1A8WL97_PLAOA|nr:PIR Superfamily Protein [Plasmodium ovale curtisi]SBT83296.1 PIR protein [Plasmodium ovale]